MNNSSGFYKNDNGTLLFGPTQITGPDYDLLIINYTEYTYPVDGWSWFESEEEARAALGFPSKLEEVFSALSDEDKYKLLGL